MKRKEQTTPYSLKIVDAVKRFFKEDDWPYEFNEERVVFTGGVGLSGKLNSVRFLLDAADDMLIRIRRCEFAR